MDFIDPKKRRANKIRLIIGYVLISLAITMTTLMLLYEAYGYGFGKNGQLIQSGLVFINSTPAPANIYLNGVLSSAQTNARLNLPAGQYTIKLVRNGYRPWQRAVGVVGGSVERFDYPMLFPIKMLPVAKQRFTAQPGLFLQSPNRQWLLIQQPGNDTTFTQYDISNAKQLVQSTVAIPASIAPANQPGVTWQLVKWSSDNVHVLIDRIVNGTNDYILFNRQNPAQTIDLTKALNLNNTTQPDFLNNAYNQFYLFDPTSGTLSSASLTSPQPTTILTNVLAYKQYGSNIILYATPDKTSPGQVSVRLKQGASIYRLNPLTAHAANYLLDLAQYNGNWFIAEGDSSQNKVYVYENPQSVLSNTPAMPLVPAAILKINQPNFIAFSANTQFVMAESGTSFAVFDAQNNKTYAYTSPKPLTGQAHATWMDGDRIDYVSNGAVYVFDYDGANQQTLQPALNATPIFFDQAYQYSYTLASTIHPLPQAPVSLYQTSMLIPADQ